MSFKKISHWVTNAVVLSFPSLLLLLPKVSNGIQWLLLLLALLGLPATFRTYRFLSVKEKTVLFSFLLFAVYAAISALTIGDPVRDEKLQHYMILIAFPPIFLLFKYQEGVKLKFWITGLFVGCVSIGVVAFIQKYGLFGVPAQARVSGGVGVNIIRFGDLSMTYAALAACVVWHVKNKFWIRLLMGVGGVAALAASAFSMTRGAWVAFPIYILVLCLPFLVGHGKRRVSQVLAVLFCLSFLTAAFYSTDTLGLKGRIDSAISEIGSYQEGNTQTSVGLRLEMFRAALALTANNPVFGVGVGNYRASIESLVDANPELYNPHIKTFHNPHNEFFCTLAERGIVGFVLLLMLLFSPLAIYVPQLLNPGSGDSHAVGAMGACLVLGYMAYGVTISLFTHTEFSQFYVLANALLLSIVNRPQEELVGNG